MASDRSAGTVELERQAGVAVIRLLGEHDMSTIRDIRDAIEQSVAAGDGIVVSVAEAEFIDSGVIHALYAGDTLLKASGRRLVLHIATTALVQRMVELSGMTSALPCTASLETAIGLTSASEVEPEWSTS